MSTHFAEVLARERTHLADVTNGVMLASWHRCVVEEIMTPQSPYMLALRQTCDARGRADFLDRWRELIAETVDRVQRTCATRNEQGSPPPTQQVDVDAQKTAVLVLAALHGGSILSQLAQDPRPLNAALDLALASLVTAEDKTTATQGPK
jgi:hypothetical protein